jgi:hypothetical protein
MKLGLLVALFALSITARGEINYIKALDGRFTKNVESFQDSEITTTEMQKDTGANRALKYTSVNTVNGKTFPENELFNDKSDLIIGIDTTGNTQGHTYLVIDGVRMDGRMFYQPQTFTPSGWTISKGLIIRYKNIPPETKAKLVAWVKSQEVIKTPTCVAAASIVLFEKADLGNPGKRFWFPSKLLDYLALNGLTTPTGIKLQPEVYTINEDIHVFWNGLPTLVRVPSFIFKVLADPYTYQGNKAKTQVPGPINPAPMR